MTSSNPLTDRERSLLNIISLLMNEGGELRGQRDVANIVDLNLINAAKADHLQDLLNGRDSFIVKKGLWMDFVTQIEATKT